MEKYVDLRLELESMTSQQLSQRLREETGKEVPDDDLVLLILGILEERDADKTVQLGPKSEEAWKLYQNRVKARARKPALRLGLIARVAIVVLAATILFAAIPQEAQADSFWDMLIRWTADIAEFFGHRDNDHRFVEYEFKTDNPGLQQVYDAVVEMGVMEPVVPMWLLDGSTLVELQIEKFPAKSWVYSRFESDLGEIIYQIDIYHLDVEHEYQKDETVVEKFEYGGISHYIMKNNEKTVVIWTKDNIKCLLSLEPQNIDVKKVLRTIYEMEDN